MHLRVTSVLYLWLLVPLLARAAPFEVDSRLPVLETVVVSEHHSPTYGRGLKLTFEQLRPDPALARFTLEEARAVVGALEEEPREKKPGREQRLLANCLLAVAAGPCVMPRTNVQPSDLEKRLREQYEALYGPSAVPLPVSLESARWFQALMLSPRYMGGGMREAAVEMFSSPTVVLSVEHGLPHQPSGTTSRGVPSGGLPQVGGCARALPGTSRLPAQARRGARQTRGRHLQTRLTAQQACHEKAMTRYYDLWDDMRIPGRWHLKSPVDEQGKEVDPWQFKAGRFIELEGTPVFHLARPGNALDFTLTGLTIPLVHRRVVSIFERLGLQQEVQFLPARVESQSEPYFILNVLQTIRCIDDARCEEVLYWLLEDNRPDKVGQYRNVAGLKIDPTKVGRAQVFRTWGWRGPIIVSERVKQAMEDEGITGPAFIEV